MNESDSVRERVAGRGPLSEVAEALLENPVLHQVLQAAFGAREVASHARDRAMQNLNVPTAAEVERLERRLRATSERLEAVEDRLDQLTAELASVRRTLDSARPG
jgi:septal ring factor EnvC (AmiA/AmiB activator)